MFRVVMLELTPDLAEAGVLTIVATTMAGPAGLEYGRELVRMAGPERLVWASDCPFVGHEKVRFQETLDWFMACVPNPAVRRIIGSDTPMRLYFS